MRPYELIVVGAGPAGLCAAIEAADAGVDVLVVDENPQPGGQIFRQVPFRVTDSSRLGADYMKGRPLLEAVRARHNIHILSNAIVWGLFEERTLAVCCDSDSRYLRFDALVIATGAVDRPVPFPGWTLPGVFTAGGALRMINSQRILPGRRVLVAGTGPLQLVVATHLLEAGAEVAALLDATSAREWWRPAPKLLWNWKLLGEGLQSMRRLRAAGVRTLRGHTLLRAGGSTQVSTAVSTRVDREWRPIPGTEREFEVDAIVCGFGLIPSIELTSLAGCEHGYDPSLGGWIPRSTADMETTVPGIFVAGETAGVAGAAVAMEEGRIAGLGAARSLGRVTDGELRVRTRAARRRLASLRRFHAGLAQLFRLRDGLVDLITPDTIVCRCEEVCGEELAQAIAAGAASLKDTRARTRAGMGPCQGRLCAPAVAALIAQRRGVPIHSIAPSSTRPPVKPVPLAALAR